MLLQMALEQTLPLEKRFELRKDHLGYLENSLIARLKSLDLRVREGIDEKTGQKILVAFHEGSKTRRFSIPIEGEKKGKNPRYLLAPFFHPTLSVHFSKDNLTKELNAALSLYTKYELD